MEFPIWNGEKRKFYPFKEWEVQDTLSWYQAYNNSKHDRHARFSEANFENLLLSVSGLFVLLSSQFRTETFSPRAGYLKLEEGRSGIGDYLIIEFPDYEEEALYDFNWSELMKEENRFEKIDYNAL